jgi:hypothetical protein
MSKGKGEFTDAFSPVSHLSGVRFCMSMATAMKAAGVDLTQGFIQAELPKDGKAIYISPPPGHVEEPDVVLFGAESTRKATLSLWQRTSTTAL